MSIETMLYDEISEEFKNLGKMKVGSDEYKATVDGITKLVDRSIELKKINIENNENIDNRNNDNEFKLKQMREDRKGRIGRIIVDVAAIAIPAGITIWGAIKSWEFEQEGCITTIMGRGFMQKLIPKK